jgi:hypothetical protein
VAISEINVSLSIKLLRSIFSRMTFREIGNRFWTLVNNYSWIICTVKSKFDFIGFLEIRFIQLISLLATSLRLRDSFSERSKTFDDLFWKLITDIWVKISSTVKLEFDSIGFLKSVWFRCLQRVSSSEIAYSK